MAAIQFPANPNAGDLFTAGNGIRYTYDGEKWKTLGTSTVGTEGQFLETPTVLTIDKLIPANTNTGAVGPMAINTGVTLTIPATSTFRTLSGRSGTGSGGITDTGPKMPISGGTFTGPVSFANNTIIKGNAIDGSGKLTLNCENNSHGINIKGPPHSAGANYTLTLPNDTGTNGQALITNGSGVSSWSTIDLSSKLSLTGGTLTGDLAIPDKLIHSGDTDTSIRFPSANTVAIETAGAQRVTVDSSGNVGIGTSSPQRALVVSDAGTEGFEFYPGSSSGNNTVNHYNRSTAAFVNINTTADQHIFGRADGEKMRIDSSGNVGIGASNPQELLQVGAGYASVNGALLISADTGLHQYIRFTNGGGTESHYPSGIWYQPAGRMELRAASSASASNAAQLVLANNGNVAIGTSSPRRQFHVHNSASATVGLMLTNADTGASNDSQGFQLKVGSDTHAEIAQMENSNLRFLTNATERMRIDSSGNVFIGGSSDANADFVFDRGSRASFYRTLYFGGANSAAAKIALNTNGTATFAGAVTADSYKTTANAVSALAIDLATGNYFTKTINGNSTFTFTNPPSSGTVGSFTLELTHTSGTVTWPSSVKFPADTAPTLTAGKTHLFIFVTDDGGSRYRGAALADYVN